MIEIAEAFLRDADVSDTSLLSYRRDLQAFLSYFSQQPERVSKEEVFAYFSHRGETLSSSSLSRQMSVVRSFYAYLKEKGVVRENPMDSLRASEFIRKREEILNREEFARLVSHSVPGFRGIRDRAMLMLLCETGLRVTELVKLELADFRDGGIFCGEGRRRRFLPLSASACDAIGRYLSVRELCARQSQEKEMLFITMRGMGMTRQGFWKNLKDRAICSGIDKPISPHTLRRSLALHLMEDGKERQEISGLLGNADPASLRNYRKGKKGD